jgi:membrane dipeptidase
MTLTWSNGTRWADSSDDIARWGGLTDFGREVVLEMNRLGMMVDISHVSDDTFWDVMEVSKAPVIASHSSVRALRDHPRNMTDDMIRALAKSGGVIQINFYAYFLDQGFGENVDAAFEEANAQTTANASRHMDDLVAYDDAEWALYRQVEGSVDWPPLSVLIDHIDHVVQLVGPEHVGLGSDFDGVTSLPVGLEHQGKMPNITRALVEKGYSEGDIKLILGENLLRVMAAVEETARKQ